MVIKVNDIDLRTLALFTNGYDAQHYIRQVQSKLAISSRTALVTLEKLEQKGVLQSRMVGKAKVYAVKASLYSADFLVLAEQYKKIQFFARHPVMREVFDESKSTTNGIVVVFGSYIKENQTPISDVDVCIVGNADTQRMYAIGQKYGLELDIKVYSFSDFQNKHDVLLKEIADNHVVVQDVENYVRRAMQWIK